MTRISAILLTAMLALSSTVAHACLGGKRMPNLNDLQRYSQIRLVEVTGVHLTEYEDYQLMRRGAKPSPKSQGGLEYIYPTSSTPDFEVQSLVNRTIKGAAALTQQFELGGCGVAPPRLHERGFVFVEPGSGYALAVWESEGEPYRQIARALEKIGHEP
jgi:hypothetical protein